VHGHMLGKACDVQPLPYRLATRQP
jgi:hypothetical protein